MASEFGRRFLGGIFPGTQSDQAGDGGASSSSRQGAATASESFGPAYHPDIADVYDLTEPEYDAAWAAYAAMRSLFPSFSRHASSALHDEPQTTENLTSAGWIPHTSDTPDIVLNDIFYFERLIYQDKHLYIGKNQIHGTKADFLDGKTKDAILSLGLTGNIGRTHIYANPKLDGCYLCMYFAERRGGPATKYSLHFNKRPANLLINLLLEQAFQPFLNKFTSRKLPDMWEIEGFHQIGSGRDGTDYSFKSFVSEDKYLKKRRDDDFEISPVYAWSSISDHYS